MIPENNFFQSAALPVPIPFAGTTLASGKAAVFINKVIHNKYRVPNELKKLKTKANQAAAL